MKGVPNRIQGFLLGIFSEPNSSWCTTNSEIGQFFHQKGFTQALKNKGFSFSMGSSRMNFLDGYQLMEEEETMDF